MPGFEAGVVTVTRISVMFTGAPLSLSLASALMMSLPPAAPLTGAGVSTSAVIGAAVTTTVTVAVLQLVGLAFSQI